MRAIIVEDIDSRHGQAAGAVEIREEPDGRVWVFAFRCPCGCGYQSWLPIDQEQRGWDWDRNRDAPTLTPSILQSGMPCKWHGYITAGVWTPC